MNSVLRNIYKLIPKNIRQELDRKVLFKLKSHTLNLVEEKQLQPVYSDAIEYLTKDKNADLGDYLEFGVYNGTSLILMYQTLVKHHITKTRLIGFDSFEGLPNLKSNDSKSKWYPGQFKCSYDTTIKKITKENVDLNRIHLVKGYYSDTLNDELTQKLKITKASIIMIDCDLYTSTREALNYCSSLIKQKSIIIFDDWHHDLAKESLGQKKAFCEFLDKNKNYKSSIFREYSYKGRNTGKAFLIEN